MRTKSDFFGGCTRGGHAASRVGALMTLACAGVCAGPSADEIWAGAEARIQQHRMGNALIRVVDDQDRPVESVRVRVEQRRHAFLFGCNIFQWGRLPEAELEASYRRHYAALLNYATLGFYWPNYEPRRGQPRHAETEAVARWCQEQGILTKGHPLAWNMGDPRWLPDDLDAIYRLQLDRIEDCVTRFRGLIDRWDVVNEATHFDREDFVKRRAPKHSAMWQKIGQIPFTRACFERARAAGPGGVLLINDYRTDPAYERVIEQLVDDEGKRLYDVIGIQSHMHGGPWSNEKIWEVCERFARFGVPLHFTEVTLLSGERGWERSGPWPTTPEGEAWQAREAVRFYTLLFSHPAVEAITWWDFSDYRAWQRAPAGFLRADMSPKPMYYALEDRIKHRWWTDTTLTTDAKGEARFRGFLGEYRIAAAHAGAEASQALTLRREAEATCTLRIARATP